MVISFNREPDAMIPQFLQTWMLAQTEQSLRIALPEGDDPRVLEAARYLAEFPSLAKILISLDLTRQPQAQSAIELNGCDRAGHSKSGKIELVDGSFAASQRNARFREFFEQYNSGAKKPLTWDGVEREGLAPLLCAGIALRQNEVDAVVAGSIATTANVIRVGLATLGLAPGVRRVSGAFIMIPSESGSPASRPMIYSDCAVNINPSPEDLVGIGSEVAQLFRCLGLGEPRLAFLSFSTHGSASSPEQQKVREAADLFRHRFPGCLADGELQVDAALVPSVAERKCAASPVAGQANCLIFPTLDAGNIAYKLTERLGGFEAVGPILLGLRLPFCDLSRGSRPGDIAAAAVVSLMRSRPQGSPRHEPGLSCNAAV